MSINGGYNNQIKMVGNFKDDRTAMAYLYELNQIPGHQQAFGRHKNDTSAVYPPVETAPEHQHLNARRLGRIQVYVRFGVGAFKRQVITGKITAIVMRTDDGQGSTRDSEFHTLAEYLEVIGKHNDLSKQGRYDEIPAVELFTQYTSDDGTIIELQAGVSSKREVGTPAYRVMCDVCNEVPLWYNGRPEDEQFDVTNMQQTSYSCGACPEKANAEPDFAYHP